MGRKLTIVTNKKYLEVFFSERQILITSTEDEVTHSKLEMANNFDSVSKIVIKDHGDELGFIYIYKVQDVTPVYLTIESEQVTILSRSEYTQLYIDMISNGLLELTDGLNPSNPQVWVDHKFNIYIEDVSDDFVPLEV